MSDVNATWEPELESAFSVEYSSLVLISKLSLAHL